MTRLCRDGKDIAFKTKDGSNWLVYRGAVSTLFNVRDKYGNWVISVKIKHREGDTAVIYSYRGAELVEGYMNR